MPKSSVVNISQVFSVDKSFLIKKIGTLSDSRLEEVLDGVRFLIEPREAPSASL